MNLEYLHRPSSLPTENVKPLLVLLHGYGSNQEDLFSFASEVPPEYEVVSMNAPLKTPMGGWAWYDINFTNAQKFNDAEQAQKSMEMIREDILEHCKLWNCDPNAVNLCGFSQGGIISYALSLHQPKSFTKVMCLSAYPAMDVIGDFDKNADFSQLHYFISHGIEDVVIPVDWARKCQPLLESLSVPFTYKEYYQGHGINPQNFRDLMEFLAS